MLCMTMLFYALNHLIEQQATRKVNCQSYAWVYVHITPLRFREREKKIQTRNRRLSERREMG